MPRERSSQPNVASASTCLEGGTSSPARPRLPTRCPGDARSRPARLCGSCRASGLQGQKRKAPRNGARSPAERSLGPESPKTLNDPESLRSHMGSERPERGGTRGDRTQVLTAMELLEEGKLGAHLPSKRGTGTLAVFKEALRMRRERYDGEHCLCPSPSGEPRLPTGPCRSDGHQVEHRLGAGVPELVARIHVSSAMPTARPLGAGRNSASLCPAGEGNTPCSAETQGQVRTRSNSVWCCQAADHRGHWS